jgi:stage V sporulation protein SpoVS
MKKILFLAIVMLAFTASCGKKEVKKVSEESRAATEAFAVAEEIRAAYAKKDLSAIERNATKNGFRAITNVMKTFDSVDLTFSPVLVEIDGNAVHVNVSWKGVWQKGGKTTEERGMAVFVLKGSPLKVDNVLRATPFKYPEH